jgi:hypothetical protein
MLDAAGRTPANSALQFTYVCDTLLRLTPGNILLLAFARAGLTKTLDLAAITDGMLNTLTYEDGGVETMVPVGLRAQVRIVCFMLAYWNHERRGAIDVTSITPPDDFSTWRFNGYNPRGEINPDPVALAVHPGNRAPAGGTPVEQFQRGIKKDKDHYPEFKDEKFWDSFRRSVETVAFTHGLQDVLQGEFVPPAEDADAHALFRFQNITRTSYANMNALPRCQIIILMR